jgi:hypothetical protein
MNTIFRDIIVTLSVKGILLTLLWVLFFKDIPPPLYPTQWLLGG